MEVCYIDSRRKEDEMEYEVGVYGFDGYCSGSWDGCLGNVEELEEGLIIEMKMSDDMYWYFCLECLKKLDGSKLLESRVKYYDEG